MTRPCSAVFVVGAWMFLFGIALGQTPDGGLPTFSLEVRVIDGSGQPLPGATLIVKEQLNLSGSADADGKLTLVFPNEGPWTVTASFVGYNDQSKSFQLDSPVRSHVFRLRPGLSLKEAEVVGDKSGDGTLQQIDPKLANRIPTPRGTIEDLLMQAPVNFTSELSSAYNVRGGSFDENLIYVNDIEVYRPFLVRSGQQEGLSFANPDMVQNIVFSAGGFEAKYGDKLSSVLDIQYRQPTQTATRVTASALGAQVQHDHVVGPVRINAGMRYRNNRYVLSTLDERGEYAPTYLDGQCYLTWDPDGYGPWEIQALGVYNRNDFVFFPETRETNIGTINQAARLTVYYDGQEQSGYETGFGALALQHATETSRIRWITSWMQTAERESFDVLGQYFLSELERDPGTDTFDEGETFGVGGFLQHGRNSLWARVAGSALKGTWLVEDHVVNWGVKHRVEWFEDRVDEWNVIDSAGFFAPHPADNLGYLGPGGRPDQTLVLPYQIQAYNDVQAQRTTAFVQDTWTARLDQGDLVIHAGARMHRWSVLPDPWAASRNTQWVWGPRAHATFIPTTTPLTSWRLAGGWYHQPPFYREMRGLDGVVRDNVIPQRAIHAVAGVDHEFESKGRPFKLVGELYYKDLDRLIPYEIENVRQRYYATNNSRGYATGLDVMLNGEFIPGVQSWLRASVLKTEEDLLDDSYEEYYNAQGLQVIPGYHSGPFAQITDTVTLYPGMIPRPADQRFSFSLLFQDEMPRNPDYKVLLSLFYGSGLPYGPPSENRYDDVLRTPAYRRVDVGFSRVMFGDDAGKDGAISLEVFNILGINNTINHNWIQDVNGRFYAVPNFLTGRRINVKITLQI
ncbi:MAG: carboxypeptidase-like regulatory domain-containing protein [Bacteroidetes bacterium]|nr:carboxypeptidase-like regulatory domain-containing protein [Bacteroidota bacterium]MDA0904189.1 carboxypeptidase-like regulatory domain-containing protein [Bacteroidota bacterium]MDA1242939.1 carboxypeptidase-like regulatory domain-containing protein [Bacteroidota bacterium]